MMILVKEWPSDDKHELLEQLFKRYALKEKEFIARALEHDPVYTLHMED